MTNEEIDNEMGWLYGMKVVTWKNEEGNEVWALMRDGKELDRHEWVGKAPNHHVGPNPAFFVEFTRNLNLVAKVVLKLDKSQKFQLMENLWVAASNNGMEHDDFTLPDVMFEPRICCEAILRTLGKWREGEQE